MLKQETERHCQQLNVENQHATNSRAIKMLKQETERHCQQLNVENRAQGYLIGGDELGNLQFVWKKGVQVASWTDVIKMYEMDIGDYDTKMLNKLTDQHIYPEKIRKMKVKNAAQVFSHRVSSVMIVFANKGDLNPSAADTVDLLLFVDKLFDSMNSISKFMPEEKILRCAVSCAVSANSLHINFWNEANNDYKENDTSNTMSLQDSDHDSRFSSTDDDNEDIVSDSLLQLGDFCLVKVFGTTPSSFRLYVSKSLDIEIGGYMGQFYKRHNQTTFLKIQKYHLYLTKTLF
ncbi:hypothetical protein QE152_g18101 [Popillia japonica]|uniref:Transposable element P transposase-like GTP-binding insertion domain-containing protein n=1 Tax=Popillia japonica TaxID=7064 RepID=A0AAW1L5P1_POPJA